MKRPSPAPAPLPPSRSVPRNFTATPVFHELLDARAGALGLDRAAYIRRLVRADLEAAGIVIPVEARMPRGHRVAAVQTPREGRPVGA